MYKILLLPILLLSNLLAFETTNIQLLHSNSFNGDAFIYDTKDSKKTTLTFEHFRTFSNGDIFMFVDMMDGEKFDGAKQDVYTEIAPRFSLSKIFSSDLSIGLISDTYIATQLNMGYDYKAYLGGIGVDLKIPYFNVANFSAYYKDDSFNEDNKYQLTFVYSTNSYHNIHLEGFIDYTKSSENTHNQLLFNLENILNSKEKVFVGTEWIYYNDDTSKTSVFQAMIKFKF